MQSSHDIKSTLTPQDELQRLLDDTDVNKRFSPQAAVTLVRNGGNPNQTSTQGKTLIHKLVETARVSEEEKRADAITVLVKTHDAKVDALDANGLTALQNLLGVNSHVPSLYANYFSPVLAMTLVRAGANPNLPSAINKSLINRLMEMNHDGKYNAMIDELINVHHADTTQLLTPLACLMRNVGEWVFTATKALELVREGADGNTRGIEGKTVLHKLVEIYNANQEDVNAAAILELAQQHGVRIDATNDNGHTPLQYLLGHKLSYSTLYPYEFPAKIAMALVRSGANPDQLSPKKDRCLLQRLIDFNQDNRYTHLIVELVKEHHAEVDVLDQTSKTALQKLLADKNNLDLDMIMTLVHLGAKFDFSLLHTIATCNHPKKDAALFELEKVMNGPRHAVLTILFYLANARLHDRNQPFSLVKALPIDLLAYIISLSFDCESLGKTQQDVFELAKEVLSHPRQIKALANSPGGVNVFQAFYPKTRSSTFTFYKSCHALIKDHAHYQQELNSSNSDKRAAAEKKLAQFNDKFLLECSGNQCRLYKKPMTQERFLNSISNDALFAKLHLPKKEKSKSLFESVFSKRKTSVSRTPQR